MQTGDAKYAICTISHDESNFPPHVPSNEKLTCLCRQRHASLDTLGNFFKNFRPIEKQWLLCFSRLG